MSAIFSFEQIIKALANSSMLLVCVIVITLLATSCSTVPTKQINSTDTTASSLTTNEKSDNETTAEIEQELECRYIKATGSRFKRKICNSKETWAAIDKKNKGDAEELVRKVNEQSGIPIGNESPDGRMNNPVTPPGGF